MCNSWDEKARLYYVPCKTTMYLHIHENDQLATFYVASGAIISFLQE